MSEAEIIAALRQLATDLADFGPSPISKDTAMQLARSAEGTNGGSLVQWWNREDDHRQKLVLRDAITLVVQAGYMQKTEAISKAIEQLPRLCDRLELSISEAPLPEVLQEDAENERGLALWNAENGSWPSVARSILGRNSVRQDEIDKIKQRVKRYADRTGKKIVERKRGRKQDK